MAPKQSGDYFFDDFEGEKLQPEWELLNPDTDAYTVEDGNLLIIGIVQQSKVDMQSTMQVDWVKIKSLTD